MGRHAVPGGRSAQAGAEPARPTLAFRGVLALTVGATTALVISWAGNPWRIAGIAALGAAAVVLLAAWVAGTVPGPHRPDPAPGPRRPHSHDRGPSRRRPHDPVQ